jgi:hypothetical protein
MFLGQAGTTLEFRTTLGKIQMKIHFQKVKSSSCTIVYEWFSRIHGLLTLFDLERGNLYNK